MGIHRPSARLFVVALSSLSSFVASPLGAARVAHEGFPDPAEVDAILRDAGHESTALTALRVESGELVAGQFDVFVVSRETTALGASPNYVAQVRSFVDGGGNIVTEYSGAGMFFSSYAFDVSPNSVTFTPQLGLFQGAFHSGLFFATNTSIRLIQPSSPLARGLFNPFAEGDGTENFFWIETTDQRLRKVGAILGDGRVGFPRGQTLPVLLEGAHGHARLVFGVWDWSDTLGVDGENRRLFLNAVSFAGPGPTRRRSRRRADPTSGPAAAARCRSVSTAAARSISTPTRSAFAGAPTAPARSSMTRRR